MRAKKKFQPRTDQRESQEPRQELWKSETSFLTKDIS